MNQRQIWTPRLGAAADPDDAAAAERRRIAAEIHDTALQSFLAALQDVRAAVDGDHEALLHAQVAMERGVSELRAAMGTLGSDLRTDERPLMAFIYDAARRARFDTEVRLDEVSDAHRPLVGQLVRELITNTAKHAQATRAWVTYTPIRDGARLEVADDGIGMPRLRPRGHLGLSLAHSRVIDAGGTFTVGPRPGGGTVVAAVLPDAGARPSDAPGTGQ
jgi:two-component system NarL family sensor kinase